MKKLTIAVLFLLMTTAAFAQKKDAALTLIGTQMIPFTYDQKTGEVTGITKGYEPSSIKGSLLQYANGSSFRGDNVVYIISNPDKNGQVTILYRWIYGYFPFWNPVGIGYGPVTVTDVKNSGNDITLTSPTGVSYVLRQESRTLHFSVIKPALAVR